MSSSITLVGVSASYPNPGVRDQLFDFAYSFDDGWIMRANSATALISRGAFPTEGPTPTPATKRVMVECVRRWVIEAVPPHDIVPLVAMVADQDCAACKNRRVQKCTVCGGRNKKTWDDLCGGSGKIPCKACCIPSPVVVDGLVLNRLLLRDLLVEAAFSTVEPVRIGSVPATGRDRCILMRQGDRIALIMPMRFTEEDVAKAPFFLAPAVKAKRSRANAQ